MAVVGGLEHPLQAGEALPFRLRTPRHGPPVSGLMDGLRGPFVGEDGGEHLHRGDVGRLVLEHHPEDEALAQGDALDAVGRGDRMRHVGLALAVVVGVADDARRGIGREWEQCRQYGG